MRRKYAMRRRMPQAENERTAPVHNNDQEREQEGVNESGMLTNVTPEGMMALQRRYGNQAVQRMVANGTVVQRRPPDQEIDFSDEPVEVVVPVENVGARSNSTTEINSQLQQLNNHIQNMWADYDGALNMFSEYMNNEHSTQAVEAQYLDVALKTVAKFAFDSAVGALVDSAKTVAPALGYAVGGLIEIGKAVWEEGERAENAAQAVLIRDYITDLQGAVGQSRDRMMRNIDDNRIPILNEYDSVVGAEEAEGGTGGEASESGTIVGAGAEYIRALRTAVSDFDAARPDRGEYLQQFVEKFALQGGYTGLYADIGNYIHLYVHVYKEGNNWSVEDIDNKWKLTTSMPNPAQLADALSQALKLQGKWLEGTKIEKMVHIKVENEIDWAINDYYDGVLVWTDDPTSYENRAVDIHKDDETGWKDSDFIAYAWDSLVKDRALGVKILEGSND
jgi:hypothetical protein